MNRILCALLASSAFVAGCAMPEASTEPVRDRGEITTGSNIPRKHSQMPSSVETVSGKNLDPTLSSPIKTPDTPGMGK